MRSNGIKHTFWDVSSINQPTHPRNQRAFIVRKKKLHSWLSKMYQVKILIRPHKEHSLSAKRNCILGYPKCTKWRFWSDRTKSIHCPQKETAFLAIQNVPSEDSDQTAQRAFIVRKKNCILGYPKCTKWRFWSDRTNSIHCPQKETAFLAIQNVPSKDSDQTAQMRKLV